MPSVFITSTGTGIGKTLVTGLLVRQMRAKGVQARAIKPVVSGFDTARLHDSDTGKLLASMGEQPTIANVDSISPWRLSEALSPYHAAVHEGKKITISELSDYCRCEAQKTPMLFIEGVGGLMVPLSGNATVLDLIQELDIPIILVSGGYLGSISHTLTALEVVRSRALRCLSVVISESEEAALSLSEQKQTLQQFAPSPPPIMVLPRLKLDVARDSADDDERFWAQAVQQAPDLTVLLPHER